MGCCFKNKSSGEGIVDEVFDSIKIKDISFMIQKLNDLKINTNNSILETDFQDYANDFLISKEYQKELFEFWSVFYQSKPLTRQIIYIKFCLILMFPDSHTQRKTE